MTLRPQFRLAPLALLALAAIGSAQDTQSSVLTLDQAVQLAKRNNGDVRAAVLNEQGARARVDEARANFFPNVTPSYTYNSRRSQIQTPGGGSVFTQSEGGTSAVTASLRLLDLGERGFTLKSTQDQAVAAKQDALQTLREVLFQVHSQYFNTLRYQELVASAQAQVDRAQSSYDATQAQVNVGQIAKKDLLQAQADLANAKVQRLSAQNQYTNAQASLKALIGWRSTDALPNLVPSQPTSIAAITLPTLEEMVRMGMENRADLIAARKRTSAQSYSSKLADREATASLGVDATFTQELTPNSLQDRAFVLNLSLPWLDFGRSKAAAKQARLSYEASKSTLAQTERIAQSQIEAAYKDVGQNSERLAASQEAVAAARENYQAASESQKLGVGTIVDVITAQASLATAESDYVQALYDYETSLVELRLVTGQPIPGEESTRT